jgi:hypothetical protein
MNPTIRRTSGGALALVAIAALGLLSGVPYTPDTAEYAVVRLAWRARGARVHRCRRPTAEELAQLPPHMRPEEICERGITPYRLRVALDDAPAVDELVRAGGARGDRPLFVFHDLRVSPGAHRLMITFEREDAGREHGDADDTESHDSRETPRRLDFADTVVLAPRDIALVTYDYERQRLVLLAASDSGP